MSLYMYFYINVRVLIQRVVVVYYNTICDNCVFSKVPKSWYLFSKCVDRNDCLQTTCYSSAITFPLDHLIFKTGDVITTT